MIYRKLRLITPFSRLLRHNFLPFPIRTFKNNVFLFSDKHSEKKPEPQKEDESPKKEERKEEERQEKQEKQEEEAPPRLFDFKKELVNFFKDKNLKFFGINPEWFKGYRKYFFGLVLGIFCLGIMTNNLLEPELLTFNQFFFDILPNKHIQRIIIHKLSDGFFTRISAEIIFHSGESKSLILGNVDHFLNKLEKTQLTMGRSPENLIPIELKSSIDYKKIMDKFVNVISLFVSIGMTYMIFSSLKSGGGRRNQDIMGVSKSNAKVFGIDSKIKVKFSDVAGQAEAKSEISEFVDFLKSPLKYKKLGARLPRGALLTGPPGTGKTMLAKACAGEAGVPFFYMSGSDFVEMFVGVGAARVRDLFKMAKEKAPAIIFVDEIDAVGRKRETRLGGGHDERDNTLNQLLVEMDGFGTDVAVVVIGATNKKELLDSALTRPGRFDRSIEITLPDLDGRKDIFLVHLKPIKLDPSKPIEDYAKRLATLTPGFSGADIANLCNEAAIMAARKNKKYVDSESFERASERVLAGLEKKIISSDLERKTVAIHESGHAIMHWMLEGGSPLLKVTIVPRSKGMLGFAQFLPNENSLDSKEELFDKMCCMLGGRVAEEILIGEITTGASDDLQKVYDLSKNMVIRFGMSEKLGYMAFKEDDFTKIYSENTGNLIDNEIRELARKATEKCRELITKHRKQIEKLSEELIKKETLDLNDLIEILGERPYPPKKNFKAYLDIKRSEKSDP